MQNWVRSVGRFLHSIWTWIAHVHTAYWILELVGRAGVIAGIVATFAHFLKSHMEWSIIGLIFVVSFLLMIVPPLISRIRHPPTNLGEIRFDYLPDNPLNHGWVLSDNPAGMPPPTFSAASERSGLTMTASDSQAVDYRVAPHQKVCNFLRFQMMKISHGAYVYASVQMASRDGKTSKAGWIACDVGNKPPRKLSTNEWVTSGTPLRNGWTPFDLSLRDEVRISHYGQEGLEFRELLTVRFRGSLSVSPIELDRQQV